LLLPLYGLVAFLLAVAALVLVAGGHDAALRRAPLGVTVVSVILLVIGVILVIAAADLVRLTRRRSWRDGTRPPCRPLVLVAFLVTVLLGAYVFLSALRTAGRQWPLVAAVGVVLMAGAVIGLVYFGRDARVTLPRVGAIALGLVGTLVGAWQFWYQSQYVPSQAGRAVALDVTLTRLRPQPKDEVVRATVAYEALGGTSVSVVGSTYTLTGSRVVHCPRAATLASVEEKFDGFLVDPQRVRFMAPVWEERPATVLAAGKFVGDGKRLDPDVSASRQFVFLVPRGSYQLLRLRAQLFAIPASVQLSKRTVPEYTDIGGDHYLYGFWHVDDDSWLHDLLYGRERWVVLRYELVTSPDKTNVSPDMRVTARFPEPTRKESRPSAATVHRLFVEPQLSDSSEPFADTELAVGNVAAPGAGAPKACRRGSLR
jgi:hypothetical protein